MQNSESLTLEPPSLPKGGGAITGLKGNIATAGPDGAATLSLPLPISTGRGYCPELVLEYHSRAGNGPFGIGWNIAPLAIRRSTDEGVPNYDRNDTFTGPDGEVLVPVLTESGAQEQRSASALLGSALGSSFTVHAYRSRTESNFSRFEYWAHRDDTGQDFWILYRPDAQVHLLGRNRQARIADPASPARTAAWLMESSVSATGEQIYWQYRAEDSISCSDTEQASHPGPAQRYLTAVWYGNKTASRTLPALTSEPASSDWLFTLVLDYGERSQLLSGPPAWLAPGTGDWLCRQDCFSSWEYGFELRTRRLCRQVLMYHAVTELAGQQTIEKIPALIARLCLHYDENLCVTMLQTIHHVAYEEDGALCSLPPLTFGWQTFTPPIAAWQQRADMGNLNPMQPYQMVDLNGEGIAGILYQDNGAWWYRSPVRQAGDEPDAVSWEAASPLPSIPALRENCLLADLNGDGYLEWTITAPAITGNYPRTAERQWLHFIPLAAWPTEFFHPQAQLADICGAGLTDLVLIGPRSVRLYCGSGEGWQAAQMAMQPAGITLPIPGADDRMLVAFSDMAGSGRQHLVEVLAEGVRYWPNTGHGQFSAPINMPGFSQPVETFNPARLYLADIDGSGTTDLLYALSDRLLVYRNLSGNRFAEPFSVMLPTGIGYDRTCSLQLADIQGLGCASLLLTVPHMAPHHWICHLSDHKPYLLNAMSNNMGASHTLHYRSSAQFWLDEKAEVMQQEATPPFSYLPFALHMLQCTEMTDEITGNRLVSTVRYRHGAWDGHEREFRGFGFVEIQDTDIVASHGTATEISMPSVSRHWYATGLPQVDNQLADEYWRGDSGAFPGFLPRFTTGSGEREQVCTPDDATVFWLQRGLKGMLLRSELYGNDNSSLETTPYTVTEIRPQVRLVEGRGRYPVVFPSSVESRTYTYERIASDPQCSQTIQLISDEYGQLLRQVTLAYPRREKPSGGQTAMLSVCNAGKENQAREAQTSTSLTLTQSVPDRLPDPLADSYDSQQQILYLNLLQNRWHAPGIPADGNWLIGLIAGSREDVFSHPSHAMPADGLTLERLLQDNSLIAEGHSCDLVAQQQVWYLDALDEATSGTPAIPPRVAFVETAELEETQLAALAGTVTAGQLESAGYRQAGYLFPRVQEAGKYLWAARRGFTTYGGAGHFWLPVAYRETLLTGAVNVTRDAYDCVITTTRDAAGLTTTTEYDWRFLTPVRLTDANDNVHTVTLDALGRITTSRFRGTEEGIATGYSTDAMMIPADAEAALALTSSLPVAQCIVYIADSWMVGNTENGGRIPPHVLTLTTDRYDSDNAQQIRQQVVFSDGFGRVLQTAVRYEGGKAWSRTGSGGLQTGADDLPVEVETAFRWAVSGRTEYDNKGQAVRTYQPYFLDSWKYVSDDSARHDLYADTHYYDPLGREWQVKTAQGWLRRTLFTPWFVVSEDENDTAAGASGVAAPDYTGGSV